MKHLSFILISALILFICISAASVIDSGVYEWKNLPVKKTGTGDVRKILKNPTRSLDMFEIKAVTLNSGKSLKNYKIKTGFDELIIVKSGSASVAVNSETRMLEEGSVIVASQGDLLKIKNTTDSDLTFYSFLFKPKNPNGPEMSNGKVAPLIRAWNDIEFKTTANGGRRDIMRQPVSALKELEIHTTTLKEGLPSHGAHIHPDEEIILVRFGTVEETINGKPFRLGPGSVIFLTNDDDHGIRNAGAGSCEYYAIRWLVNNQ